jgi:MFS transporter, NNP family, nitrate/nitrite transporter
MKKLTTFNPEDEGFWKSEGMRISSRNLWISVPALLSAFAVWLYWSVIIVQMKNVGFPFDTSQLYSLAAIAGLSGATLRIPNSFLVSIAGGRNVIVLTTALLLLPALFAGYALQSIDTPYSVFVIAAALSGIGGGNFASSMSNISFFYPKKQQGTALGINAGLGNLGVSVMQLLIPLVATTAVFFGLEGIGLPSVVPTAEGITEVFYVQNSGFIWVPFLVLLAVFAWFGMNNMPQHYNGNPIIAFGKILWLILLGFATAALGLYMLLSLGVSMWVVLPITIVLTLVLMRYLTPASVRKDLSGQFVIFKKKHTWVMTWLYVMTFGSFIGYSAAFPKLIQDVFGSLPDGSLNPNAPNPLAYAWLGPLVGSLIRPVGGWISDKLGGARVTHWDTILMILSALGVAYYVQAASQSATPEEYFVPFLALFLLLFITTGIGNGSTFRMIPIIFEPKYAGPILGWTSAVAAYGAFIIPKIFGTQIQAGHAEYALYGFAVYYFSCLVVNWWFYARKNAEIPC